MAKRKTTKPAESEELLTLTEVSKRTGISMPTLQRYKKLYQSRLPTVGKGRSQRYKPESLDVFRALKEENVKKRGRPRKASSAKKTPAKKAPAKKAAKKPAASTKRKPAVPKKKAAAKAGGDEGLLTLTEIGKRTGISYPTLLRYVKNNLPKIPHVGKGRGRRYAASAVEVFESLRAKSPRGRAAAPKKAAKGRTSTARKTQVTGTDAQLSARVKELEKSQARLVKAIERLEKAVRKPVQVTVKR